MGQEVRIALATVQVPFIQGGAELQTRGLADALQEHGHQVETITLPFRFSPPAAVRQSMRWWLEQDFSRFDCGPIDEVIALKFPAIYLQHPRKTVWLMHQHRSVYELLGTAFGESAEDPAAAALREQITAQDTASLADARAVYTTSPTVSERLWRFNGIRSKPVLHPPGLSELLYEGPSYPYIFAPSRLETLKRQELLIRAMALVKRPITAIIAGDGGQRDRLTSLVRELSLDAKVKFIGRVDDLILARYYRHALAVYFAPFLEDYGYITLEAMLSGKPVLTCTDSGGPTAFVEDGVTGSVTAPEPAALAQVIDRLAGDGALARRWGANGLDAYRALGISWSNVVSVLLQSA